MLLEYTVRNYTVFKNTARLSFVASNYDKETYERENVLVIPEKKLRVVKSAVVYGANAAGKTKLFDSLAFMRQFVLESSKKGQQGDVIDTKPFLLSESTKQEPSEFEIIFLHKDARYRYGFEVTSEKVIAEWLFYKPESREYQIFYRDTLDKTLETHTKLFRKGILLENENMVRDNALMLSVAAQFNDEICSTVLHWFTHNLSVLSSIREYGYKGYTMAMNDKEAFHKKIMQLLNQADLSIQDIHSKVLDLDAMGEDIPVEVKEQLVQKVKGEGVKVYTECETVHYLYDRNNKVIGQTKFSMDEDESHGTQKFFYLAGPILDTLEKGKTLFIDEFDARLHPNLVLNLFSLFNTPSINTKGAQLVITAQNTIFLQSNMLRKDQIWFVEKDRFEAAHLYSLADFKSNHARKGDNYEAKYLKGKYGAIPYLTMQNYFADTACEKESRWPQER